MTAIAWDGKTLAVDSGIYDGQMILSDVQKLFKLNDGSYFAGAGAYDAVIYARNYLNGDPEANLEYLRSVFEKNSAILIKPDGSAYCYDGAFIKFSINYNSPWVDGCGSQAAMAALRAGCNAVQAIHIAAKTNVYVKIPVQYVTIENGIATPYFNKKHPWCEGLIQNRKV